MHTRTSAMGPWAAALVAAMRLRAASDEGRSEERWLPTMTIGTGGLWTMKLRAEAVWSDLKLAAWQKVIQKPSGEMHTPHMMAENIDKFLRSQQTVARTLMTPDDIKIIHQFGQAMREIAWKDPNPSGTGTANLFYASQWGQTVLRMVMNPNGPWLRVVSGIMNWSGFKNAAGQVAAQRAVNATTPTRYLNLGPIGAEAGVVGASDRRQ